MIDVFMTIRFGGRFGEEVLREITETARARFEGMPELRSKAFTLGAADRRTIDFHIRDCDQAAKALFTDEPLEPIAGFYGMRPGMGFVPVAPLVENPRS